MADGLGRALGLAGQGIASGLRQNTQLQLQLAQQQLEDRRRQQQNALALTQLFAQTGATPQFQQALDIGGLGAIQAPDFQALAQQKTQRAVALKRAGQKPKSEVLQKVKTVIGSFGSPDNKFLGERAFRAIEGGAENEPITVSQYKIVNNKKTKEVESVKTTIGEEQKALQKTGIRLAQSFESKKGGEDFGKEENVTARERLVGGFAAKVSNLIKAADPNLEWNIRRVFGPIMRQLDADSTVPWYRFWQEDDQKEQVFRAQLLQSPFGLPANRGQ